MCFLLRPGLTVGELRRTQPITVKEHCVSKACETEKLNNWDLILVFIPRFRASSKPCSAFQCWETWLRSHTWSLAWWLVLVVPALGRQEELQLEVRWAIPSSKHCVWAHTRTYTHLFFNHKPSREPLSANSFLHLDSPNLPDQGSTLPGSGKGTRWSFLSWWLGHFLP